MKKNKVIQTRVSKKEHGIGERHSRLGKERFHFKQFTYI